LDKSIETPILLRAEIKEIMMDVDDHRLNVVNLFDGVIWRLGKFIRSMPFYDRINSATIVRRFCHDAAGQLADMPQRINIETVNKCNGSCSFCPANTENDPRLLQYMSEQLIHKIAEELAVENYSGSIALFLNNEPLIDKRISQIVGIFRKSCPKNEIFLSTNGSLLTAELYLSLFDSGLSHLIINNYNNKRGFTDKIGKALEQILSSGHGKLHEYMENTVILLKNKDEILNSRAGEAPNKINAKRYESYQQNSCANPFRQMSILPDGRVSLCCEDFAGRVTVGNIETEYIRAVWNGSAMRTMRAELQTNGRKTISTCQCCDYGHLGGDKAKSYLQFFVKWFSKI
jgi:radical SAM protein with 4Fe4S-binding SPASM domain